MAENEQFNLSVIDVPKWDVAQWRGVLYVVDNSFTKPPILGLIFRYETPAVDIFTGWRSQIGREDDNEQIRISIVEGDIQGQDYGYTVHITIDPQFATQQATEQGHDLKPGSFIGISRVFRMNPDPHSQNLPNFKRAYTQLGKFLLIPVIATTDTMTPQSVKPRFELGISKKKIVFRNAKEIQKGDIDSVVFVKGL
jgi:hypothetical protein